MAMTDQIQADAEAVPLGRIQKLVAKKMLESWTSIPHVTHHDWADVDDLERDRIARNSGAAQRVSALSLYVKAVAATLQAFPRFNAVFVPADGVLWQKRHCHIGIAISIKNGLVVGVVRDCEAKTAGQITVEIAAQAAKARTSGLSFAEMADGTFTVSSLGASGGDGFTPIINAPQVAILGIGRMQDRPVRAADGAGVEWRRMLPLSLSYDHRVIGGADAAEFLTDLRKELRSLPDTWA